MTTETAQRVLELDEAATPGPFTVFEHSWSDSSIATENGGEYIASSSIADRAEEDTQAELEAQQSADLKCLAYYRTAAPELARRVLELERVGDVLANALLSILASASPNEREHPSMLKAWSNGEKALADFAKLKEGQG